MCVLYEEKFRNYGTFTIYFFFLFRLLYFIMFDVYLDSTYYNDNIVGLLKLFRHTVNCCVRSIITRYLSSIFLRVIHCVLNFNISIEYDLVFFFCFSVSFLPCYLHSRRFDLYVHLVRSFYRTVTERWLHK